MRKSRHKMDNKMTDLEIATRLGLIFKAFKRIESEALSSMQKIEINIIKYELLQLIQSAK